MKYPPRYATWQPSNPFLSTVAAVKTPVAFTVRITLGYRFGQLEASLARVAILKVKLLEVLQRRHAIGAAQLVYSSFYGNLNAALG
jgi:hypothetical protein